MISQGHRWPDIQRYALCQIEAFLAAIGERDRQALKQIAVGVRIGHAGKKRDFDRLG